MFDLLLAVITLIFHTYSDIHYYGNMIHQELLQMEKLEKGNAHNHILSPREVSTPYNSPVHYVNFAPGYAMYRLFFHASLVECILASLN